MLCPTCAAPNPEGSTVCFSCGSALSPSPGSAAVAGEVAPYLPSLPENTALANGHYTIGQILGQGGFGITYSGGDTNLRRAVAIKEFFPLGCARHHGTVQPTMAMSGEYENIKARFLEEARTLARFNHVGIVRVFATFEENNTAYMVMEFLQGHTLQQMLDERGILDEREAIGYAEKVGEALQAVHAASLIHRDIKPDNILITHDGRVVLIDFGTARQFAARQTVRQTAMITPGYAPLEQYGSQARFGVYSDIYALGATLYHCLTGQLPPQATDRAAGIELPEAHWLNPNISLTVSSALSWALRMKVDERPQNVRDFLDALRGVARPQAQAQAQPAMSPQVLASHLGSSGSIWVQRSDGAQLISNAAPDSIVSALHFAFASAGAHSLSFGADRVSVLGTLEFEQQRHEIIGQVTPSVVGSVISVGNRMAWQWSGAGPLQSHIEGILAHVEQALRSGQAAAFPGWPAQPPQSQLQSYPSSYAPPQPYQQRPLPPLPSARSTAPGLRYGESGPGLRVNNSGQPGAVLPTELQGFNWGACLLNWIWALRNGQAAMGLALLVVYWVPFFALILAIYLGVNGNEMAWRGRAWNSIEEFQKTQQTWSNWGIGLVVTGLVLALLSAIG